MPQSDLVVHEFIVRSPNDECKCPNGECKCTNDDLQRPNGLFKSPNAFLHRANAYLQCPDAQLQCPNGNWRRPVDGYIGQMQICNEQIALLNALMRFGGRKTSVATSKSDLETPRSEVAASRREMEGALLLGTEVSGGNHGLNRCTIITNRNGSRRSFATKPPLPLLRYAESRKIGNRGW